MRRSAILVAGLSVLLLVLLLGSCGNLILAKKQTITFALVINEPSLDNEDVYANVHDNDAAGALVDQVSGTFSTTIGTANSVTATLLCTKPLPTGQRYHLEFYIDLDDNQSLSIGDLKGIGTFNVMPNATYCEAMVFYVELEPET